MNQFKESVTRVARRGPALPGVRSLAAIPDNLMVGMSETDQQLLGTALYIDSRDALAKTTRPIRDDEVRAVLAQPIDTSSFNRQFLDRRLVEVKQRLESDPGYERYFSLADSDPFQAHCEDIITGETVPCYRWSRHVLLVPRWIDQWE